MISALRSTLGFKPNPIHTELCKSKLGVSDGIVLNERYLLAPSIAPLGIGRSSVIWKGYDHVDNKYIAIKVTQLPKTDIMDLTADLSVRKQLTNELGILQAIESPYFIKLLGYNRSPESGRLYLFMELCEHKSIRQSISERSNKLLDADQILKIALQVASGLSSVTKLPVTKLGKVIGTKSAYVMHRALSPECLLYTKDYDIRISNFLYALSTETESTKAIASLPKKDPAFPYASPQRIEGSDYTYKCDVWSLGMIMFELLTGTPFDWCPPINDEKSTKDRLDLMHQARQQLVAPDIFAHLMEPAVLKDYAIQNLIYDMIQWNEENRLSWVSVIDRIKEIQTGVYIPKSMQKSIYIGTKMTFPKLEDFLSPSKGG